MREYYTMRQETFNRNFKNISGWILFLLFNNPTTNEWREREKLLIQFDVTLKLPVLIKFNWLMSGAVYSKIDVKGTKIRNRLWLLLICSMENNEPRETEWQALKSKSTSHAFPCLFHFLLNIRAYVAELPTIYIIIMYLCADWEMEIK